MYDILYLRQNNCSTALFMLRFLKYMLQLVLSPVNGWEDIAKSNIPLNRLLSKGLYPLMVVASLTTFCSLFYSVDATFVSCLQSAVIIFISFFVTYFFANIIFTTFGSNFLNPANEPDDSSSYHLDSNRASTFIIYNLGILEVLAIMTNLLPVKHSLLQFFPFLVALLMWKGADFMNVAPNRVGHFTFLSVFSILVPIYLLQYFFSMLLS